MRDSRELERYCAAVSLGAVIPYILGYAGLGVAYWSGGLLPDVDAPLRGLMGIAVLPGAAAGAVGVAVRTSRRASVFGAIVFACSAGQYWWLAPPIAMPFLTRVWASVVWSAMGALVAGLGAVLARSIPSDNHHTMHLQFTMSELLAGITLLVLLLGGFSRLF